ncbi:MAG: hypothetical protein ACR2GU_10835 [Rubrobacteraceae bacterium]
MRALVRLATAIIAIWVTWQLIGQFDLWGDPLFLGIAILVLLPTLFLVLAWLLRREVPGGILTSFALSAESRPLSQTIHRVPIRASVRTLRG